MTTTHDEQNRAAYLAALGAAVLCYAALGSVLAILPGYVHDDLGAGAAAVGIAVGAPALTALMTRPVGGRLADRLGPLPPLLAGAAMMVAGAVPAALSHTLGALLVSRLAVGAGEGLMMSATVLWLLRLTSAERRGRALGHIGLSNFCGLAVGPLIAAALGGSHEAGRVLWLAAALPVAGALAALFAARRADPTAIAPSPQARDHDRNHGHAETRSTSIALLRQVAPAGVGLLLVNLGYVSVLSFGGAVARAHGTGLQNVIVPVFAVVIIVTRTVAAGVPDRIGGALTAAGFAAIEAVGLIVFANVGGVAVEIPALIVLSIGQSMAVPGLGLVALANVAAAEQGAAAGMFFAWFDAGVGLGGPLVGVAASLTDAAGALDTAAVGVAGVLLIVALLGKRRGTDQQVEPAVAGHPLDPAPRHRAPLGLQRGQ